MDERRRAGQPAKSRPPAGEVRNNTAATPAPVRNGTAARLAPVPNSMAATPAPDF
ncbi:MAG TPA: hypothetical protein VL832_17810 [Puia sp.]|nr:hypothetical protein [Puia sp.]